jgi:archaellum biogenesis protein FlaJ (TadC family)
VKEAFEAREGKIRRTVDTTGMLAEAYLVITVVLGVTLFSLYLLQSLLFQNSSGLESVSFYAYILVPILSVTFAWLLDSTQAKWPYTDMRPYKIFATSIPVGLALFFTPLPLPLYLHLSVALIATTAAPAFYNQRYSRERRGMEKMLPDFILDVAEGRKIGLSPERSIERLVDRNYGPLSKYVAKMGSQLTWGISLSNVVSSFTTAVTSWITKAVGTLMIEVVEVGGGTVGGVLRDG